MPCFGFDDWSLNSRLQRSGFEAHILKTIFQSLAASGSRLGIAGYSDYDELARHPPLAGFAVQQ